MADQPPPPYPVTDSEKTQLLGEVEFPSAPPPDAQSAYPPPSSAAPVQPPYPPSAQPAPYPYPSQPYPPPAASNVSPVAGTEYPASAPPVSVPPADQVSNVGGAVTYSVPPPTPYGYPGFGVGSEQRQNTLRAQAGIFACVCIAGCVMFFIFLLAIAITVPIVSTRQ